MTTRSSPAAAALVVGFGTALAQWVSGFLLRLPPAATPSAALLVLMLLGFVAGGALAGRAGHGARAGAGAGFVASLVNLLVLGSLLSGDEPNAVVPTALIWVPGSLLVGASLGALGAALGGRLLRPPRETPDWTAVFARTAASATLALVFVGGLVTSHEAGLAVVDWPNSFGYNMFLYPLSRMVGGIYYEHAHRLFGSLVGLTTVALFVRILVTDSRGWLKAAAATAVLLVIGQGILGGLRVTGYFTMSDSPEFTRPNLALAMVHGVTGQLFFAWMVCLAAFTSPTWKERRGAVTTPAAGAERTISAILVLALIVQLVLGVRTRHTGEGTMLHITFAILVLVVLLLASVRIMGGFVHVPALKKSAGALLGHGVTQLVLGGLAFYFVSARGGEGTPPVGEVFVTTLHQTVGALLLANAVILAVWTRRLLQDGPATAPETAAPAA